MINYITKKSTIFLLFSLLALKLISCVSPYEPNLPARDAKLVVSGLLSNLQGDAYNNLSVTYSTPFNNDSKDIPYPQGARVYVTDNKGNREDFIDAGLGVFKPKSAGYRGFTFRTYTLHIDTQDGKKYESKPEYMKPVSVIDTAYLVFKERFSDKGAAIQRYFDVITATKDPATEGDLYRWSWKHYEQINTCKVIQRSAGGAIIRDKYPCCEPICFDIYRCEGCIDIGSDNLVNGRNINHVITQISYDKVDPIHFVFEQQSLSLEAYKFWQRVKTQINNSGGVFDTPPATVIGNMFNVNDPNEQVLGYFGASEITRKGVYLDRHFANDVLKKQPFNFNNVQLFRPYETPDQPYAKCVSCQEGIYRTQQVPVGWKF